ncbi:hypothetical protein QO010_004501 [Caulobacter ginsengisoli]|uniref:Uncharacterized protein n=1 Tax=Caulobacter ginsengisoli TaxID=400775 RepID=A0ABU0IXI2_9CAUL|nr:hypothetical protein [Caulobacter ginsengisoli]MDQ0466705.1 hypothetical protein [Caulobacter ginsengisoli]
MKFRIAFIPSTATPRGEALDGAISEILLGFEWRQDDTGEAIQLEDGVWVEVFREKEAAWFLVLNPVEPGLPLAALVRNLAERTASLFCFDMHDTIYEAWEADQRLPPLAGSNDQFAKAEFNDVLEPILSQAMADFAAATEADIQALRQSSTLGVCACLPRPYDEPTDEPETDELETAEPGTDEDEPVVDPSEEAVDPETAEWQAEPEPVTSPSANPAIVEGPRGPGLFQKLSDMLFGKAI